MTHITGQDIVAEARRWIGTPWRHQARLRGIGVDCGGLVVGVGQALGLPVQDHPPGYARLPDGVSLRSCVEAQCRRIPALEPGAVLLMRWEADPQHLAIVSTNPEGFGMIHAWAGIRRVVEHGLTPEWQVRIVRDDDAPLIYRLPGLI